MIIDILYEEINKRIELFQRIDFILSSSSDYLQSQSQSHSNKIRFDHFVFISLFLLFKIVIIFERSQLSLTLTRLQTSDLDNESIDNEYL